MSLSLESSAPVSILESAPGPDRALRLTLLNAFLEGCLPVELAGWLRRLNMPTQGNADERRARLREHADYLTDPVNDFPRTTRRELDRLTTPRLKLLSSALGLPVTGSRDTLYRRILREVGYREGWLPPHARLAGDHISRQDVEPFVRRHPLLAPIVAHRELAAGLLEELSEVFGADRVSQDVPVSQLPGAPTIDIHVGETVLGGIGIAIANRDAGIPRDHLTRYRARYGTDLIVLLLSTRAVAPDAPRTAESLRAAGVESIITTA